uniref:Uncharacterized protein n=1 Tax=Zea mays TaxID=4577 RepID=B7ZXQ6_MAIZE|nr:unknown [Zea mays]
MVTRWLILRNSTIDFSLSFTGYIRSAGNVKSLPSINQARQQTKHNKEKMLMYCEYICIHCFDTDQSQDSS